MHEVSPARGRPDQPHKARPRPGSSLGQSDPGRVGSVVSYCPYGKALTGRKAGKRRLKCQSGRAHLQSPDLRFFAKMKEQTAAPFILARKRMARP